MDELIKKSDMPAALFFEHMKSRTDLIHEIDRSFAGFNNVAYRISFIGW